MTEEVLRTRSPVGTGPKSALRPRGTGAGQGLEAHRSKSEIKPRNALSIRKGKGQGRVESKNTKWEIRLRVTRLTKKTS